MTPAIRWARACSCRIREDIAKDDPTKNIMCLPAGILAAVLATADEPVCAYILAVAEEMRRATI